MIFIKFIFTAVFFSFSFGDPTGSIIPCKKGDEACILASAREVFKKFILGFPDLGVDSSDPLTVDEIIGDLSTLKYKFTNTTVVGLSGCEIGDYVSLDVDNLKMNINLICANLKLNGRYNINGQLIILPIEGEGDYSIHCKKYLYKINADLKQVQGNDGQPRLSVKNFKFVPEAMEAVVFDFKNLFHGNKDLANGVLKFANQNWKEVADFVQVPVVSGILKKVMKNFSKFLKLIPLDEFYLE